MKHLRAATLALFAVSAFAALLPAVPPPDGSAAVSQAVCRINKVATAERRAALRAAPFFSAPLSPTTAYVAVIRVDFADQPMAKTQAEAAAFFERMKTYYHENSYGLMTVSATVTAQTYRLPSLLSAYAQGICSNFDQIAKDALSAADAHLNFADARADVAGSQPFHHVMIYHAGIGAETANDSGCQTDNIWSVFAPTVAATASQLEGVRVPFAADGVSFNGVTIVPESESQGIDPLGVICHEYGHQLGLPDLYKSPTQPVVGKWSLMDGGIYLGVPQGSNPAHMDAWSKQFLGFSRPQTIQPTEAGSAIALELALSSGNAFVHVPITSVPGVDGNLEYFLIERRAPGVYSGRVYDQFLPLGGLPEGYLVWHVNDSIAADESRLSQNSVNSGAPTYGVDLVEADGAGVSQVTAGKESDPFPGSKGKIFFATPLSNSFSGQQTGIVVTGFSGSSTLAVKKAFGTAEVDVGKAINFPNPGGPGYPQRLGAPAGTVTTVVLNTSRPVFEFELTLHDQSGRLVRKVTESQIRANGAATTTNKFVYEFDWDGKDDEGRIAAPGVYFYRFKADDKVIKTGKLALIR